MKKLKIVSIEKVRKDKVYDIKHKIDEKYFLEHHPNLIGNNVIISNCSRHAGGLVVGEELDKWMPLINSGGVRQTPWSEGNTVRHLEPLGFIKFDVLGLGTLRMIRNCIEKILVRHYGIEKPNFKQIRKYYYDNLHPDKIDLTDQNVYENIFHKGQWVGIFQFTNRGAQEFCKEAKPRSITDISAVTSIYRPGTLSSQVDKKYLQAKEDPTTINYPHPIVKEILHETHFLIFQEQLALLAHKLGKDISLDEGNMLRKVLTKKGTGKEGKIKNKLYKKFIDGCLEKEITKKTAEELWEQMVFFSRYSFNASHATAYSIISYQCAWLYNYYPIEWIASFLDYQSESEDKKESAINIVKSLGFDIKFADINQSEKKWKISEDDPKTLIQPLTCLKGLGEEAVEQIIDNRPYETIEQFIFNKHISYSKLNKRMIGILIKGQILNSLMDSRFHNLKHFFMSISHERPLNEKKLEKNIEKYKEELDFSDEEKIEYIASLTGIFPMHLVVTKQIVDKLKHKDVPPISEYDDESTLCWAIPREVIAKKTKSNKDYYIVNVIDEHSVLTQIKCWGIDRNVDMVHINRPYLIRPQYNETWGFSTKGAINKDWILLG